jgi:hypothetical protein
LHCKKRNAAIIKFQRFYKMAKQRRADRVKRTQDRATLELKMHAAARLFQSSLGRTYFFGWREVARATRRTKQVLVRCVEKYYLGKMHHALKLWWVSTRITFRVETVGGARVVVRDKGALLPCIQMFKEHFVRSEAVDTPYQRGSWRDTVPLGHEELAKFKPRRVQLKTAPNTVLSKPREEVEQVRQMLKERQTKQLNRHNWMYPSAVARSLEAKIQWSSRDDAVFSAATNTTVENAIQKINSQRDHVHSIVEELRKRRRQTGAALVTNARTDPLAPRTFYVGAAL